MEGWLETSGGKTQFFIVDAARQSLSSGKSPEKAKSDPKRIPFANIVNVLATTNILIVKTKKRTYEFKTDHAEKWQNALGYNDKNQMKKRPVAVRVVVEKKKTIDFWKEFVAFILRMFAVILAHITKWIDQYNRQSPKSVSKSKKNLVGSSTYRNELEEKLGLKPKVAAPMNKTQSVAVKKLGNVNNFENKLKLGVPGPPETIIKVQTPPKEVQLSEQIQPKVKIQSQTIEPKVINEPVSFFRSIFRSNKSKVKRTRSVSGVVGHSVLDKLASVKGMEKYVKMMKNGLPEGAIRNAMARDGVKEPKGVFDAQLDLYKKNDQLKKQIHSVKKQSSTKPQLQSSNKKSESPASILDELRAKQQAKGLQPFE